MIELSNFSPCLYSFFAAFILCLCARPILIRLNVIDRPNARSSHTTPTVRGLGVGIVCSVLGTWIFFGLGANAVVLTIGVAGMLLAGVSFFDDLKPLPSSIRFACHAAAAIALFTVLFLTCNVPQLGVWAWLFLPVGFLFVSGYTNAFNFMDGINGIAGFQGLLTGIGTAFVLYFSGEGWSDPIVTASLVIAGACAGFLPLNFPKPIGFMGDVASATLGYWLAAIVLWCVFQCGWQMLIPLSLLHANFILDTGITLVRRKLRGEKLSEAHREHFYQRLVQAGKSHAVVTGLEVLGQLIVITLMWRYVVGGITEKCFAVAGVFVLWSAFFIFAERNKKQNSI